jgi:hypothetical protein
MDKIMNLSEKNVDKELLSETVKILEESEEYMKENTMNLSKRSEDKELFSGELSSKENTDKNKLTDLDNNLSDNKIDTVIKPTTDGNNVYVSICSCSLNIGCCMM